MPSPKCCSPLRRCPQSGRDALARALPGQALQGSRCQKVLLGPGLTGIAKRCQRFEPDAKGPPLSAPSQAALALASGSTLWSEAKAPSARRSPMTSSEGKLSILKIKNVWINNMSHTVKIYDTCIGCTQCVRACPTDVLEMIPWDGCKAGQMASAPRTEDCVGCKRCETACPTDFLSVRVTLGSETTRSMGLAY